MRLSSRILSTGTTICLPLKPLCRRLVQVSSWICFKQGFCCCCDTVAVISKAAAYLPQVHTAKQLHTLKPVTRLVVASSASAAAGWPSRDSDSNSNSSNHEPTAPTHASSPLHPFATAVATVLLAFREAAARTAAGTRTAARRAQRLQVWLGKPEALLFREGCQLLACMMFIMLYVWR